MKKNKTKYNPDDRADWKLDGNPDDLNTIYAKSLGKNKKALQNFKKFAVAEFNRSGDIGIFLEHLKIIAKAESVAQLAAQTKMKRNNVYRFLSKDNDPRVSNLVKIAHHLGLNFKVALAA